MPILTWIGVIIGRRDLLAPAAGPPPSSASPPACHVRCKLARLYLDVGVAASQHLRYLRRVWYEALGRRAPFPVDQGRGRTPASASSLWRWYASSTCPLEHPVCLALQLAHFDQPEASLGFPSKRVSSVQGLAGRPAPPPPHDPTTSVSAVLSIHARLLIIRRKLIKSPAARSSRPFAPHHSD